MSLSRLVCMDEMMVPYKGHCCRFRQHMRKKPTNMALQVWALWCNVGKHVYDVEIYLGALQVLQERCTSNGNWAWGNHLPSDRGDLSIRATPWWQIKFMQYVDVQDHMHESYTSHLGTKKRVASFGIFCIEYNHYDHLHFLQGARKRRQGFTAEFKNMFLWVIETNPIAFSLICYDALREFVSMW